MRNVMIAFLGPRGALVALGSQTNHWRKAFLITRCVLIEMIKILCDKILRGCSLT